MNRSSVCIYFSLCFLLSLTSNLSRATREATEKPDRLSFSSATASFKRPGCRPNEDQHREKPASSMPFFMIADGHGGADASVYAADKLYENLVSRCSQGKGSVISRDAIDSAFSRTNFGVNRLGNKNCGSTAVAAFFSQDEETQEYTLHVANIGDSLAVLGVESDSTPWIDLTESHRWSNKQERDRINNRSKKRKIENTESAKELPEAKRFRGSAAKKCLFLDEPEDGNLFKATGGWDLGRIGSQTDKEIIDEQSKTIENWELETGLSVTRCFGHSELEALGLSSEPHVTTLRVAPEHQFILLYSDGFGDHISNDDAVAFVKQCFAQAMSLEEIAERLLIIAARNDERNLWREDPDDKWVKEGIKDDMTLTIVLINRAKSKKEGNKVRSNPLTSSPVKASGLSHIY